MSMGAMVLRKDRTSTTIVDQSLNPRQSSEVDVKSAQPTTCRLTENCALDQPYCSRCDPCSPLFGTFAPLLAGLKLCILWKLADAGFAAAQSRHRQVRRSDRRQRSSQLHRGKSARGG